MNMRWAWTLPVLSALATTLVVGSAQGQGGAAVPQGYAAVDPAMVAAMQAQAYGQMAQGMYAPTGGHHAATFLVPSYGAGAMYPPQVMQAAYMAADGMQPPAQLPMGPMPDAYGLVLTTAQAAMFRSRME